MTKNLTSANYHSGTLIQYYVLYKWYSHSYGFFLFTSLSQSHFFLFTTTLMILSYPKNINASINHGFNTRPCLRNY